MPHTQIPSLTANIFMNCVSCRSATIAFCALVDLPAVVLPMLPSPFVVAAKSSGVSTRRPIPELEQLEPYVPEWACGARSCHVVLLVA